MIKELLSLPGEVYKNRRLVKKLAKNDFKMKYAGSYFGTIWAFIQPIVTILVYYFVFGVAMRGGSAIQVAGKEFPFVLYLVAGIIPWFFFQEGLRGRAPGSTAPPIRNSGAEIDVFSRKIAIFVAYYNKDIPAINGQHRSRTEYKRYEIQ